MVTKYVDKKTKGKKKNHGGKRLEGPVKEVNKDLDRLNILIEGKTMKGKYCDSTQKIYKVIEKGGGGVTKEVQQKIKAKTAKVIR